MLSWALSSRATQSLHSSLCHDKLLSSCCTVSLHRQTIVRDFRHRRISRPSHVTSRAVKANRLLSTKIYHQPNSPPWISQSWRIMLLYHRPTAYGSWALGSRWSTHLVGHNSDRQPDLLATRLPEACDGTILVCQGAYESATSTRLWSTTWQSRVQHKWVTRRRRIAATARAE